MDTRIAILGMGVAFLLTICIVAVVFVGGTAQFYLGSEEGPKPVRIAQIAALETPHDPLKAAKSAPIQAAAAVERPVNPYKGSISAGPTATTTSLPTVTPTVLPSFTPTFTPTPTPIVAYPGMATRLVIPKVGLDAPVVLAPVVNGTWSVDHLDQMIGHLEGTAPPGSDSNIVLAGHVTLTAGVLGPFSNLSSLTPGDIVIVYEGGREHLYQIESQQTVTRTSVEVVYPTETGQITLITCINWNSREGRYNNRLIVKGKLIEQG